MASGYILASLEILDPPLFAAYRQAVAPLLAEFGGQTVVSTADTQVMEGAPAPRHTVLVRFPSVEKAVEFLACDRYIPLKAMRDRCARSEVQVMGGEA